MSIATSYIRRDPAEIRPWTETCGEIGCLIGESRLRAPGSGPVSLLYLLSSLWIGILS